MNLPLAPMELRQMGPTKLGVIWNDKHQSLYTVRNLRLECRCANCVDEWSREKILKPESVPNDVKPMKIESVGRYAFRIDWSDGHNTGIRPQDRNSAPIRKIKMARFYNFGG